MHIDEMGQTKNMHIKMGEALPIPVEATLYRNKIEKKDSICVQYLFSIHAKIATIINKAKN